MSAYLLLNFRCFISTPLVFCSSCSSVYFCFGIVVSPDGSFVVWLGQWDCVAFFSVGDQWFYIAAFSANHSGVFLLEGAFPGVSSPTFVTTFLMSCHVSILLYIIGSGTWKKFRSLPFYIGRGTYKIPISPPIHGLWHLEKNPCYLIYGHETCFYCRDLDGNFFNRSFVKQL